MKKLTKQELKVAKLDEGTPDKYRLDFGDFVRSSEGQPLFRVVYNKVFTLQNGDTVRSGDKGGYIWSYNALSQFGKAAVLGDAQVSGDSRIMGNSLVINSRIESSNLEEAVRVLSSTVKNSYLKGSHNMQEVTILYSHIVGSGKLHNCKLKRVDFFGSLVVTKGSSISDLETTGSFHFTQHPARIKESSDAISITGFGSAEGVVTAYRGLIEGKKTIVVTRGCFSGTLEEFKAAVIAAYGEGDDHQFGIEYLALIKAIKLRLGKKGRYIRH